jgi:hypothetical protein
MTCPNLLLPYIVELVASLASARCFEGKNQAVLILSNVTKLAFDVYVHAHSLHTVQAQY